MKRTVADAVPNTQGSSPPQMLVWGGGLRGRGSVLRWTSLSHGPRNEGFFLSHRWERAPGPAFAFEAAGPGSRDPSVCLGEEQGDPCRRPSDARAGPGAWSLPSKPFHWPHAAWPAAAAARSTEQPARPSSRQRLTQQVAGSGSGQPETGSGNPPLSPLGGRLGAVAWAASRRDPGGAAGRPCRVISQDARCSPQMAPLGRGQRIESEGGSDQSCCAWTDLDRGTYLEPLWNGHRTNKIWLFNKHWLCTLICQTRFQALEHKLESSRTRARLSRRLHFGVKRYTRQKKVNNQSHIVLMFRKKCGGMTWVRKALSERVTFELKKFLTDNLRDRLRDRGLKWLAHSSLDTPVL